MNIAIIGPTHPYKGGIAKHTTELARRLEQAGHNVVIESWKHQYPWFYPGTQRVARPEIPPFNNVRQSLSWRNPFSWLTAGRRLRQMDQIILVWWVPTFHGPIYRAISMAAGKKPAKTVLCHNVLPHESRPGDRWLAKQLMQKVNKILVHTQEQAQVAKQLTPRPVAVTELPAVITKPATLPPYKVKHKLLFFGFIRPYKGVDVLLKALARVPDVQLTIAGECWGGREQYDQLINDLGLQNRVHLQTDYVPEEAISDLILGADAVVLSYKHGTASFNVQLAHAHGRPVIATKTGSLPQHVRDGKDGLLCKPDDVEDLAKTIQEFYKPGRAAQLAKGVKAEGDEVAWQNYLQTLLQ